MGFNSGFKGLKTTYRSR